MSKPRRLAEIRAYVAAGSARLMAHTEAVENFALPRPKSWRAKILRLIVRGETLQASARAVGVSRSGLRHARKTDPDFAAAFEAAHSKGLSVRFAKSRHDDQALQLNAKTQRFNDRNAESDRFHCNHGAAKLTTPKHVRRWLDGSSVIAIASRKCLIPGDLTRMGGAL